jgi:hypothetical protein
LREEFETFRAGLSAGWEGRYRDQPEDMIAFGESQSIGLLIRNAFSRITSCPEPLVPSFVDPRTLSRARLSDLRAKACVVLLAAVTTRHPALHRCFRRSYLDSSPATLVVRIAWDRNMRPAAFAVNALVEEWFTSEFHYRLQEDDRRCTEVADWDTFRRWVRNEVPLSIPKCAKPDTGMWP